MGTDVRFDFPPVGPLPKATARTKGVRGMQEGVEDRRSSPSLPGSTRKDAQHERGKTMNTNPMKTATRLCAVIVLLGWASQATAAKPPHVDNTSHPVTVTVIDAGNSIQSDGTSAYTGTNTNGIAARLWDIVTGPDHLHFEVNKKKGRFLRLSIPSVTGGTVDCSLGRLKPNQNANNYNFYNLLPIGSSTNEINENFGGTFSCDAYVVTYAPCIVIEHTGVGFWRITAPPVGCDALVTVNGVTLGGTFPVPFQVEVDQLDVP
jgi:hypothetical protein